MIFAVARVRIFRQDGSKETFTFEIRVSDGGAQVDATRVKIHHASLQVGHACGNTNGIRMYIFFVCMSLSTHHHCYPPGCIEAAPPHKPPPLSPRSPHPDGRHLGA